MIRFDRKYYFFKINDKFSLLSESHSKKKENEIEMKNYDNCLLKKRIIYSHFGLTQLITIIHKYKIILQLLTKNNDSQMLVYSYI